MKKVEIFRDIGIARALETPSTSVNNRLTSFQRFALIFRKLRDRFHT